MNIFTVRHGESDKNLSKKDWQYPLTTKGCSQAEVAGNFLQDFFKEHQLDPQKSIIIYSPYFRTKQTAEIINKNLPLQTKSMSGVIEYQKNTSVLEGENIKNYNKSLLESNTLLKTIFQEDFEIDANETPNELVLRAKQAILYIINLNYENVILVTHNGFIRAFDIAFLNKPIDEYYAPQKIRNCSIRHYEITKENNYLYHGEILKKAKQEENKEK